MLPKHLVGFPLSRADQRSRRNQLGANVSMLPKHLVGFPLICYSALRLSGIISREDVSMLPKHLVGFPRTRVYFQRPKPKPRFQCFLSIWWDFHVS